GKLDFDATSKVYDINGELIASLHGEQNRTPVAIDNIPLHLQKAVLAMEDNRFYDHHGFDLRGIGRAVIRTLTRTRLEGGSTITNQVAKLAFLTEDRRMSRKIQEVFVSLRLEKDFTKDEILEFYLNRLFMGGSAYGMQEAALYYFGKNVSDVTLAESAMLAGLISAPNYYSPYASMERAVAKQTAALNNMVRFGYISEAEKQAALEQPITLANLSPENKVAASYFVSYVRDQVIQILKDKGYSEREAQQEVYTGGLSIYTTLDNRVQRAAEKGMEDTLNQYLIPSLGKNKDERNAKGVLQPQCGLIILDVKTGGIRAMIGGREPASDIHNRAVQLIKQQPGSSIKPLTVFGPAIESGKFTAASIIVDEPIYENGLDKPPYPVNYSRTYSGPVTLRYAIQKSLNVPAWKIGKENGINKMLEFAKRLGITTLVDDKSSAYNDRNLASLTIGAVTHGVVPIEMAKAFGAIANKGIRNDTFAIKSIEDDRGQIIYEHRGQSQVVLSEEVAFVMTSLLESPVNYGTASTVRSRGGYYGPAAGKTGTTDYNREGWFAGYTPDYAAGIYIGHDDNTTGVLSSDGSRGSLPGRSSSNIPATMFGKIMSSIYRQIPVPGGFYSEMPENVVQLAIDMRTGLLAGPYCPAEDVMLEYFIKGTEPQQICLEHVQVVDPVEPPDPEDPEGPEEPNNDGDKPEPEVPENPDDDGNGGHGTTKPNRKQR
ncbi:MAG TPA: penicillin-binding protein, partial [Firmicutes bacterium]|nr:penicillin-binding protein [Bacillota bacterium]